MPYVNNMNIIADCPINRLIYIINYFLVILCYIILDVYYYQGFFLRNN
jgi:hypothetical protein